MKKGLSILILLSLFAGMLYAQGEITGVWKSLATVNGESHNSGDHNHNQNPIFSEACSENEASDEKQTITITADLYPYATFSYALIRCSTFYEYQFQDTAVASRPPLFLINRSILI